MHILPTGHWTIKLIKPVLLLSKGLLWCIVVSVGNALIKVKRMWMWGTSTPHPALQERTTRHLRVVETQHGSAPHWVDINSGHITCSPSNYRCYKNISLLTKTTKSEQNSTFESLLSNYSCCTQPGVFFGNQHACFVQQKLITFKITTNVWQR